MRVVRGDTQAARPSAGRTKDPDHDPARVAEPRYPGVGALFLIWTVVGAVTSARHYFEPSPRPDAEELAWFLACIAYLYPWVGLTPLAFRLERRFPLGTRGWVRQLGWLAVFSVALCLVAAPLMLAVMWLVVSPLGVPVRPPRNLLQLFRFFPVAQTMFWSSVAGGYVVRTRFELREQERRSARLALEKSQLEAGLNQAQLEVLRARLNPHFLFNSLQNISVMTKEDPHVASQMLTRLGDLLRTVLRQDSQPETTLRDEITLTQLVRGARADALRRPTQRRLRDRPAGAGRAGPVLPPATAHRERRGSWSAGRAEDRRDHGFRGGCARRPSCSP